MDRESGRLVELPDSPFLLGELDAPAVLAELVDGPVTVDNDVNWAARAEHSHGGATGVQDFVYVFLGEGLGCAVVSDGEVRRGHAGLAGEIAYVVTAGPGGMAMRLTDVFDALGLRRPGTAAIDVPALLAPWSRIPSGRRGPRHAGTRRGRRALGRRGADRSGDGAVGGSWGRHPSVLAAVAREFADAPRHVAVEAAASTTSPPLAARETALRLLRDAIISAAPRAAPRIGT